MDEQQRRAAIDRYQYLIDTLTGGNQKKFAQTCGLNIYTLNRIVTGKYTGNPLGKAYVNPILNTWPEISRDWLVRGVGEPGVYSRKDVVEDLRAVIRGKDEQIAELRKEIDLQRKVIERLLGE